MDELKKELETLPHVDRVYLTPDGTWYFHKPDGILVVEKSRDEIFGNTPSEGKKSKKSDA